jgi:hypothetical protein
VVVACLALLPAFGAVGYTATRDTVGAMGPGRGRLCRLTFSDIDMNSSCLTADELRELLDDREWSTR